MLHLAATILIGFGTLVVTMMTLQDDHHPFIALIVGGGYVTSMWMMKNSGISLAKLMAAEEAAKRR